MTPPTMDKKLTLGHDQIDCDHQKLFDLLDQLGAAQTLFDLLDQLAAAIKAGEGKEVCVTLIDQLIDQLISFTRSLFATEERLMTRHRYAQAAAHKAECDGFVAKVLRLRQKIGSGSAVLSIETLSVMRDWLSNHIEKNCKALVASGAAPQSRNDTHSRDKTHGPG